MGCIFIVKAEHNNHMFYISPRGAAELQLFQVLRNCSEPIRGGLYLGLYSPMRATPTEIKESKMLQVYWDPRVELHVSGKCPKENCHSLRSLGYEYQIHK